MRDLQNVIKHKANAALVRAAMAVCEDVRASGTMPFDTGDLQNAATYVDVGALNKGRVAVVSDTVYARRKYFHPEFNFDKSRNKNAGARWFAPYVDGAKRDFALRVFAKELGIRE